MNYDSQRLRSWPDRIACAIRWMMPIILLRSQRVQKQDFSDPDPALNETEPSRCEE